MKKLIRLFLLLLITQTSFAQGPWTREKGSAYIQIGETSLQYDKIKVDGEELDLTSNVSDLTTQFYAEYGITNKLEAQLIVPFRFVSRTGKNKANYYSGFGSFVDGSLSGIGNVSLGLKYKLFDSDWKISGGVLYSAKTALGDGAKGLSTGFNANTILPYISVGSSSGKWYYFGNLGYGYVDNLYSDFIKFGAEVGYNIIQKGHLMLVLDNRIIVSKENPLFIDIFRFSSYYDRQSYSAVGLKFNYEFKKDKFGANFAAIGAFALDNAPVAPTLNFGVYAKL
jgi:hypothetical protein